MAVALLPFLCERQDEKHTTPSPIKYASQNVVLLTFVQKLVQQIQFRFSDIVRDITTKHPQ